MRVAGPLTDRVGKQRVQRLQLEMGGGDSGKLLLCGGGGSDVHVLSKLKENLIWRDKLCLPDVKF